MSENEGKRENRSILLRERGRKKSSHHETTLTGVLVATHDPDFRLSEW